jgi:hypothetical protein
METKATKKYVVDEQTLSDALILIQDGIYPNRQIKQVTHILQRLSSAELVSESPAEITVLKGKE